jgi:alpha-tubulin suppressor-like RCC1 family protein
LVVFVAVDAALVLLVVLLIGPARLRGGGAASGSTAAQPAWMWGRNPAAGTDTPLPSALAGFADTIAVSAGAEHALAVRADGGVLSWGQNLRGQLGDGTTRPRAVAGPVPGVPPARAVAAGQTHSLALARDGTVWAWGANAPGELGDGSLVDRTSPVQVAGLGQVVAVAANGGPYGSHSLALTADGTVWAWGYNNHGELGDGTFQARLTPVRAVGVPKAVAISAGDAHSLAVAADGTVWAWGDNSAGQLGDGTLQSHALPAQVRQLGGVTAVAGGVYASFALKSDGTVWGWGADSNGQLGSAASGSCAGFLNDLPCSVQPVQVSEVIHVTAIAAGSSHGLARISDGTVWTWGSNTNGELGIGTTGPTTASQTPVEVHGLTGVGAISAGYHYSLALKGAD